MKARLAVVLILLGALALEPTAFAKGDRGKGGGGGGGGGNRAKASKPSTKPASRPSANKPSKPSGGSGSFRPSGGGGGGGSKPNFSKPSGGGGAKLPQSRPSMPDARPANRPDRPAMKPSKPMDRPSTGNGLPSYGGGDRPNRPDAKPNFPSTRPGNLDRPDTRPGTKPGGKPDVGDFLGMKPDKPGDGGLSRPGMDRPSTRPGQGGERPDRPTTLPGGYDRPGSRPDRPTTLPGGPDRPGTRPDRPTTLPGQIGDRPGTRPDRPTTLPGEINRPGTRPDRPTTLPGQIGNRPGVRPKPPIADIRPGKPNRPPRPDRPDKWQNIQNNNNNQWNSWRQKNDVTINNFNINRSNHWNSVNTRYNQAGWAGRYGHDDYWEWRDNVWDYRKNRCEEIWDRREDYWDDMFDDHWWRGCWWAPRPIVGYHHVDVSPWWAWRPVVWAGIGAFFGAAIAPEPIVYDPGTTVIYEGDTYYINGKASGTATEARRTVAQLATPAIEEIPVPEPAAQGQPETWLPLGVWALTQQEHGDATMFMQISVDKNGIVAGAYKNVMTGDEQPIVGQVDKQAQRVAWHVGEATGTIYETGLSSLENDVASVFVHFGEAQTQTWLLVRLPSPEIPPGTVKLPERKK